MVSPTDKQAAEFFQRSYRAADGLWFMKVEERRGFDEALEIDRDVWKVVPKIQARMLKSMLNAGDDLEGLANCLNAKLSLEGFLFEIKKEEKGLTAIIKSCPWHGLMIKSNRGYLSEKVNPLICGTENSVFASEFSGMTFELMERICKGSERCILKFR